MGAMYCLVLFWSTNVLNSNWCVQAWINTLAAAKLDRFTGTFMQSIRDDQKKKA